jgi:multiple sugar transport system substrate-binding protein
MRELRARLISVVVIATALMLEGCHSQSPPAKEPAPTFRGITLKIAALDDPAIVTGVAPLLGEWIASRQGEISINQEPVTLETLSTADVFLFPAQRLGDLADLGALVTIANEAVLPPRPSEPDAENQRTSEEGQSPMRETDTLEYLDIVPAYREQVTRYGSDRLALPCGGSALVLVYRRDAFEGKANVEAARSAGVVIQPPATWSQLGDLAKFLNGRDWNGAIGPDYGIALALGADSEGVANTTFLALAASLGQHRDHFSFLFDSDSLTPRIASPPFVAALEELIALRRFGPPGMERFDAQAARAAFRAGNVAMLIDRAEQFGAWSGGKPIGVAPLPGSERVFEPVLKVWQPCSPPNAPSYLPRGGGWLIGINRKLNGTQLDAAVDFAKYLAGPDNLNRLRSEASFPMLPVRASQFGQGLPDPTTAPDVDSRQWSEAVRRTLMAERVVPGLRIPGAGAYLDDLAQGRQAALGGEAPQKALEAVSAAWAGRTASRGPKRQLWHYRRSLNTLSTLPQPPPIGK